VYYQEWYNPEFERHRVYIRSSLLPNPKVFELEVNSSEEES
jgi:hypothetical protein